MFQLIKRTADFTLALLLLLVLSPLLIPIVIGLKLTGEGEVFYLQDRVGYKNRMFKVYKFATMLKNSPNMKGGAITMRNDPRITPMGGFLRKTKINELPQLLNVLFGDMSFVGPRPVMMKQSFEHYPPDVQAVIYNVKPGVTGIGSVIFRDEEAMITRANELGLNPRAFYTDWIYPYKGELEKWYQANQSFWVDTKILFLTAWHIVFPDSELAYRFFPALPRRDLLREAQQHST